MPRRSEGARQGVLDAAGYGRERREHESAPCDYCGKPLEFPTDAIGRSMVCCSDPKCPNHRQRPLRATMHMGGRPSTMPEE